MKSLSQKNKFDAMKFARDNSKIQCVLYAKAGVLDNVLNRLNPNHFKKSYNIVTKSFYDDVVSQKWLLNSRDTDFNKINTI